MIPCPIKYLTGYDCPGCGFQRSFYLMVQGNLKDSFFQYPPLFFFIISLAALIFHLNKENQLSFKLLQVAIIALISSVTINYLTKQFLFFF